MTAFLFWLIAGVTGASAIMVLVTQNIVRAAAWLLFTLAGTSAIFFLLGADFVGATQLIVYVGGILVLFIFVIMLISVERSVHERQFNRQWTIGLITALLLIGELGFVLWRGGESLGLPAPQPTQSVLGVSGNSQLVGETLYGKYLLPFEIASILLLVAIIGSVALAKKKTQAE